MRAFDFFVSGMCLFVAAPIARLILYDLPELVDVLSGEMSLASSRHR